MGDITVDQMEAFLVNNPDVDRIASHLNRFNPIRVMKMQDMEIRHSAILSWLLHPQETHGLGDAFLKAFLSEALRGASSHGRPMALEIANANLRDAEVKCEWQHIDIFVISEVNGWAFVIENKFHSSQHQGQLTKYKESVAKLFKQRSAEFIIRGIFLTLWGEEPEDPSYVTISYDKVCALLTEISVIKRRSVSDDVGVFLEHYIEVLEEATGMSKTQHDMEQLARELYRQHSKVIDFIVEHGTATEFSYAVDILFGEEESDNYFAEVDESRFQYFSHSEGRVSFMPVSWLDALEGDGRVWPGCSGWWAGYPVICWIELFSQDNGQGRLQLVAEVGPFRFGEENTRADLIELIKNEAKQKGAKKIKFQSGSGDESRKFSKFFKNNFASIDDVQDSEKLAGEMKNLLRKFSNEFSAVAAALPEYAEYGEQRDHN